MSENPTAQLKVRAFRLSVLVTLAGLAMMVAGFLLGANLILVTLGGLIAFVGFGLLSIAGTLKAAEQVAKAQGLEPPVGPDEAGPEEG